ncbi:MAG: hypothetical protein J5717_12580 [Lachnospiraceae bacterium]|nr:hypothetical protein [Lachnospiraceae bacterium]
MKTKLKDYLPLIIVVGIVLALLFSGVRDLADKDHVKTIRVEMCKEVVKVVNIFMIIPMGNDYYYFGLDTESGEGAFFQASKSWYSKNFDSEGMAFDENGVQVVGLMKKPAHDKVEYKMEDTIPALRELGISVNSDYVVYTNYKFIALCKIGLVALGTLIVLGLVLDKKKWIPGKVFGVSFAVFLILFFLLFVRYTRFLIW